MASTLPKEVMTIDQMSMDLNKDGKEDRLALLFIPEYSVRKDSMIPNALVVSLAGGQTDTFINDEFGFAPKSETRFHQDNYIRAAETGKSSKYFTILPVTQTTILLLRSANMTDKLAPHLTIYRFDRDKTVEIYYDRLDVNEWRKTETENQFWLSGLSCYSQRSPKSKYVSTYAPYKVLRYAYGIAEDDYATSQYNKEKLGYFDGADCHSRVYVITPAGQQPFLMNAEETKKIYFTPR